MLEFYASNFAALSHLMVRALELIGHWPTEPERQSLAVDTLRETIEPWEGFLQSLPMSDSLRFDLDQITDDVAEFTGAGGFSERLGTILQTRLTAFQMHVLIELKAPLFLMIRKERREFYEQNQPPFGVVANGRFPLATLDTVAAARCIALEEWTASVFHLMRVLEHGLRAFAAELRVPMAETLELENWKNVIDQIEAEIRKLEPNPKSPEKSELTRAYSEMASHFRYFKDAWRNHLSHARSTYDERQALEVYENVRSFMGEMGARLAGAA